MVTASRSLVLRPRPALRRHAHTNTEERSAQDEVSATVQWPGFPSQVSLAGPNRDFHMRASMLRIKADRPQVALTVYPTILLNETPGRNSGPTKIEMHRVLGSSWTNRSYTDNLYLLTISHRVSEDQLTIACIELMPPAA